MGQTHMSHKVHVVCTVKKSLKCSAVCSKHITLTLEFQTRMTEPDEFQNVDSDDDPGDEKTKAAKALWVRVANSTEYAMEVEISLPIPGVEMNPLSQVRSLLLMK